VAAETGTRNAGMVKGRWGPRISLVAVFTDIVCSQVISGFAGRFGAIMATEA
jgi:hypothetical protein